MKREALGLATAFVLIVTLQPAGMVQAEDATANSPGGTPTFALERSVIAGGSGTQVGSPYTLRGTAGQSDAEALQPSVGGAYTLVGGFWAGVSAPVPAGDPVFRDGFE